MQAIQASLAERTFGAVRCSGEKKTRSRRSKEERKTMVESFIKNYQNLNKGKFPSLNLTHKEVGGSFYTVREIVREIIQDNRVLGPGSMSSKALNLEYFPEEQEGESFSTDISAPFSISTVTHTIEQRQGTNYSSSNGHKTSSEIVELDGSFKQEYIDSNLNNTYVPQVLHVEQYCNHFPNGIHLTETQPISGYDVPNLGKQLEVADDMSKIYEEEYAEVQKSSSEAGINSFEQPPPELYIADEKSAFCEEIRAEGQVTNFGDPDIHKLGQPAPSLEVAAGQSEIYEQAEGQIISSRITEFNMVEPLSDVANGEPKVLEQTHVQLSSSESPETYKSEQATPLCEASSITPLGEVVGDGGDRRSELAATFNSSAENNLVSLPDSLSEVKIILDSVAPSSSDQMQNYYPVGEHSESASTKSCNLDESEEKDMSTTLETQKSLDSSDARVEPMLSGNGPIINWSETTGTVSSIAVNEVSEESRNKPVSQKLDSFASVPVKQPLFQSNKLGNNITNIKSTSQESLQPIYGRHYAESKAEHESTLGNSNNATTFESISQDEVNKESDTPETNNFWRAVKSFLSAVAKFWTE